MAHDTIDNELSRLLHLGFRVPSHPTPRQSLLAKQLVPGVWDFDADEILRHAKTDSPSPRSNAGRIVTARDYSLLRAWLIDRLLDRLATGKADLLAFDPEWLIHQTSLHQSDPNRAAAHVMLLGTSKLRELPRPSFISHGTDCGFALQWAEDDRSATIDVAPSRAMTLTIGRQRPINIGSSIEWDSPFLRLIVAATEWVYFGQVEPTEADAWAADPSDLPRRPPIGTIP